MYLLGKTSDLLRTIFDIWHKIKLKFIISSLFTNLAQSYTFNSTAILFNSNFIFRWYLECNSLPTNTSCASVMLAWKEFQLYISILSAHRAWKSWLGYKILHLIHCCVSHKYSSKTYTYISQTNTVSPSIVWSNRSKSGSLWFKNQMIFKN